MFDVIAFDADDTLWHNERVYRGTEQQVIEILARYHDAEWIARRIYETEIRNLQHYGYGFKGYTLSLIETAIELTDGRISGAEIGQIIELARTAMRAPIHLLDGVAETIAQLSATRELMIITKGDLFEQEAKVIRSGLAEKFRRIEIVPNKTRETYESIAARYDFAPERFLMIGNSLRSDILPVLAMGGRAVYIPYEITWEHEQVPEDALAGKEFFQLAAITELPALLDELTQISDRQS